MKDAKANDTSASSQSAPDLRRLPQVDKLLRHPALADLGTRLHADILTELARRELNLCRLEAGRGAEIPELDVLAKRVAHQGSALFAGGVRQVLNGTGVILNTNLGRAPVPNAAVKRLSEVLPGYCSLEIDLETGKRGERTSHLELLLSLLIKCETAIVVNNNAAAVMLAVSALAAGKEVIVSRGELIEIGGSFRLPDVITSAGGILREVGTTNRTRVDDYRKALSSNTGLILRCHRSNYEITGFTEQPKLADLAALAQESNVPFIEDLGSGAIIDLGKLGLRDEPTVPDVLKAGADVVLFSGDKLLGGLQSGIIAGKKSVVERLRRHPIYRALRADKLVLGILESVLSEYLTPEPETRIPALRMAMIPASELEPRAQGIATRMRSQLQVLRCVAHATESAFGGGTLPSETLSSFGLMVDSDKKISAERIVRELRFGDPPLIVTVSGERVMIDLRTIRPEEEEELVRVLLQADQRLQK